MSRRTAGYGRYGDHPETIGCPWAKSDMTPCVARDGRLAITSPPVVCAGCGNTVRYLWEDLADDYRPAADAEMPNSVPAAAEVFRDLVREATKPVMSKNDSKP